MAGARRPDAAFRVTHVMFDNKVLLITGGTGSFGGAVLERFLRSELREIRVFSRDEKKQEDMRLELKSDRVRFYIGDVRDYGSVRDALQGVHCVFHAAALKQVPSCEFYPMEAVRTNILGAENVMRAAVEQNVERCVLLSTDKAVYPINAMGMSKAMMEKLMVARSRLTSRGDTVLTATRYGNVMGSRGSIIPLFLKQLREGLPLTVTNPNMTRFLMSLEQSVELVLHALQHAQPGDIFVQKAHASTVMDLAVALRELLERDNPIRIIGTRHGEKLYESLVSHEEMVRAEETDHYFRIPSDSRDLNYDKYFVEGEPRIGELGDYNSHNTKRLNLAELKEVLRGLDSVREAMNA
jgi:UDP-N-acetylglucosamine 4,6-dehydratase